MAQVKERGGGGEESKETFPSFPFLSPLFHFLALVSLLARSKSKISFLGLSLLRNLTETLLRRLIFLLVSVCHVGAHPGEHQHDVSIQISISLGNTFLRISRIRNIPLT